MIGATPCRAAAVLALVAPGAALAAGNTLTMTGATFDSTSPAPGSTEALSGGYAVAPAGSCYTTANTPYEPPQTGVSKEVWVKASTTAPASPEMIFGDQFLWIAEDTAGFLVVGSGPYFSHDASLYINPSNNSFISSETPVTTPGYQLYQNRALTDGQWHHIVVSVEPSLGPTGAQIVSYKDSYRMDDLSTAPNYVPFYGQAGVTPTFTTAAVQSMSTGIGGGVLVTYNGAALIPFSGEIDEAACFSGGNGVTAVPTAAFAGSENGLIGLWHLAGNGADSSTWTYSALPPYSPPPSQPSPTPPTPANGFPLEP